MKLFRLKLMFTVLSIILINGISNAQDSTGVVKLANTVLKNFAPEKVIYNRTLLLEGEEGTSSNITGQKSLLELKAGSIYTISLVLDAEEGEQLTIMCAYNNGDAQTEIPVSVNGNTVVTKVINVDSYKAFTLDVKKSNTFTVFVGGRRLPENGVYYKLIVNKL